MTFTLSYDKMYSRRYIMCKTLGYQKNLKLKKMFRPVFWFKKYILWKIIGSPFDRLFNKYAPRKFEEYNLSEGAKLMIMLERKKK